MSGEPTNPAVSRWLCEPLPADVAASLQRLERSDDVQRVAVMPDVHLAHEVCVGAVIATSHLIYPNAVGGDIGCGMAAMAFDAKANLLADETVAARLLAGLYRVVPSNRHPRATMPEELPLGLAKQSLSDPKLESIRRRDGLVQFGTLGRGNHFLEFQKDDVGQLWLMVHSGSRALGQAIRDHHLQQAVKGRSGLQHLDAETDAGKAYITDARWACSYAAANRRAMAESVAGLMRDHLGIQAIETSFFDCDHNHLRREMHFNRDLWVHRKGANSAADGERGIIPGSMGTCSFHVAGRGEIASLRSSSHGAGRRMSRDEARRRISIRDLDREMDGVWFDHRAANQLRDEAPAAYKDIRAVMRAQRELTRIVRKLRPVLSYKGMRD